MFLERSRHTSPISLYDTLEEAATRGDYFCLNRHDAPHPYQFRSRSAGEKPDRFFQKGKHFSEGPGGGRDGGRRAHYQVYFFHNGALSRSRLPPTSRGEDAHWVAETQVVVPAKYRQALIELAHDGRFSGHLGVRSTTTI